MDVYRPPSSPPLHPHPAEGRPRERWRTRSATALRLYVASQCASAALTVIAAALFGVLRATQPPDIDSHGLVQLLLAWHFWVFGVLVLACDVGAIAASLMTMKRLRNRTRVPSVLGALLGLVFWPCVVIFAGMSSGAVVPFLVGAPRAGVLLFSLTAISIARDVGDLGEVPRQQRVARWQGAALAFVLLAAATQGNAGASPLGLGVPAIVGALAFGVFLLMGVPSLLRLARVAGATRPE